MEQIKGKAYYHLPGLFEFYDLYQKFLKIYQDHREYFYDWCEIASLYGAPYDCLWGGGRVGFSEASAQKVLALTQKYGISARLTFSNSLLTKEHLSDKKCNQLCRLFERAKGVKNGVIVHSDLLVEYLKSNYPELTLISSTTKVITSFENLKNELDKEDFSFVVPDFRLNLAKEKLNSLSLSQKKKVELLCNECCYVGWRRSAVKVWARISPNISAKHPMRRVVIVFPRRCRALPLSALTILSIPICPWVFKILKSRAEVSVRHSFWSFCSII